MSHRVEIGPGALADVTEILDYLLPRAGEKIARRYVDDLMSHCMSFSDFPMRGLARDDIAPGLRIVGYHRKATIAFSVEADLVTILRIFHAGRDIRFD